MKKKLKVGNFKSHLIGSKYSKKPYSRWLFPLCFLTLAGCHPTPPSSSSHRYNPQAIPLSLNDPELRSCQYPGHIRIAHFPMFHYPPDGLDENTDQKTFEDISKSQFQLLHTIIAYKPYIAVFSEGTLTDFYNEQTYSQLRQGTDTTKFERLDGVTKFSLQERYNTAWNLFPRKVTQHFEYLTHSQKRFLVYTGGALTAYLLEQIPRIYKTASEQDMNAVMANLNQISRLRYNGNLEFLLNMEEGIDQERDWWLLHFRERRVREEVDQFYRQYRFFTGLVLIAYGANHKFHNEFSSSFSDGSFCLGWHFR